MLALAAAGLHLAALAQAPARARVGVLSDRTHGSVDTDLLAAFRTVLRDRGWIEGRNLVIVERYAGPDPGRLATFAQALAREAPDAIFATTLSAALAAKAATASIPVVFNALPDPVEQGLVGSLARPGGNLTGVAVNSSALIPKRLQLLKEAMPRLSRVAVLFDPRQDDACLAAWDALRDPAAAMGIAVKRIAVDGSYEEAFDELGRGRYEAVLVPATARFYGDASRIAGLAHARRIVSLLSVGDAAEEHTLMVYGPLQSEAYSRAAGYIDRILRGGAPGTMAVEQPTRYELVLNLGVARSLGIALPRDLRARADRLIP